MRLLSSTLTAAQESANANPLVKLVLVSGGTTYTFYNYDRIKKLVHTETPDSYVAYALLDNHDNFFTSLDLRGYTATLSLGYKTTAGDEYSACAPLKVLDLQFVSSPGNLLCYLTMVSELDLMAGEYATENYNPAYIGTSDLTWKVDTETANGESVITLKLPYPYFSTTALASIVDGTFFTIAGDSTTYTVSGDTTINGRGHWNALTHFDVLDIIIPSAGRENGRIYMCTATSGAGNTGTTEPVWPETYTDTVTDGDLTWTNSGCNVVVTFTPVLAQTAAANATVTLFSVGDTTHKSLIDKICAPTMPGLTVYPAVTTSWDSEDSLIDVITPSDSFIIYKGSSTRKERLEWLIRWTKEVYNLQNDGELHFFSPTVSGTSYDYTYAISGDHPFLSKVYQNSIVRPNQVFVSPPDNSFIGGAVDASYTIILYRCDYIYPATNEAQGDTIAEAIIQRSQLDSQGGDIRVPIMNVGQEVWDYVKITDAREGGVSRTGNIQKIVRTWESGKFDMVISFGGSGNLPAGNAVSSVKKKVESFDLQPWYKSLQKKLGMKDYSPKTITRLDPDTGRIITTVEKEQTQNTTTTQQATGQDNSAELVLQMGSVLLDLINEINNSVTTLSKRLDDIQGAYDANADTNISVDKIEVGNSASVPNPIDDGNAVNKGWVETYVDGHSRWVLDVAETELYVVAPTGIDIRFYVDAGHEVDFMVGGVVAAYFTSTGLSMGSGRIQNVDDPTDPQDVATKKWVEDNFQPL